MSVTPILSGVVKSARIRVVITDIETFLSGEEALATTLEFVAQVQAAGYTLNGERRLISRIGGKSGFEIQLGID